MDWTAVALSVKLAIIVAALLLVIALPLAYWITFSRWRGKFLVEAVVALPLVLPPTVLGFYVLLAIGSRSPVGRMWERWTGHGLAFTFEALVLASILYSLPFAVQPIAAAFAQLDTSLMDAAATLGATRWRAFTRVVLPLSLQGIIAGGVLSFAHTIGEFGVVLMIGGAIPGQTKVMSAAIYDYVETMQWREANILAGGMVVFAFAVILTMILIEKRFARTRA